MLVKMTAKQIREIKPYMYFIATPDYVDQQMDFDFIFSKDKAFKIHRDTGFTEVLTGVQLLDFDKERRLVEGISDNEEVFVEPYILQAWLRRGK